MKANLLIKTENDKKSNSTIYHWQSMAKFNSYEDVLKIVDKEIAEVECDVRNLNAVYRVLISKRNDLKDLKEFRKIVENQIKAGKKYGE